MTRNSIVAERTSEYLSSNFSEQEHILRIDTDLLIPGRGKESENATLVCDTPSASDSEASGKILYVGPTDELPLKYSTLSATKVPVLMPGLWDCHVRMHRAFFSYC